MSKSYYADSSALLKRHVPEAGSLWIRREFGVSSGNQIYTSKLSIAEVLSALNRRRREASISATAYQTFAKDFVAVSQFQYKMLNLTDAVLIEAQRLLETRPLRAGDSVQLASAVLINNELQAARLSPLIFLASDARLLAAAAGEGLLTDDPLNHP